MSSQTKAKPSLSALQATIHLMAIEANNWYMASKRCNAEMPMSPNVFQSLSNQSVVCNAFAIEFYVKALLIISGTVPSYSHDYHKDFQKIPTNIRDKANTRFKSYWNYQDNDLAEYLKVTSKWFLEFRYTYEHVARVSMSGAASASILPGLNLNQFWLATRALHNTLIELAPQSPSPPVLITGESHALFTPGNSPF